MKDNTLSSREVTADTRADLIASTVDVVTGRAFAVLADGTSIEVNAPHMQVVTWLGQEWARVENNETLKD